MNKSLGFIAVRRLTAFVDETLPILRERLQLARTDDSRVQ